MKGESVPIAYVTLSFTVIFETFKKLSLPSDFLDNTSSSILKCLVYPKQYSYTVIFIYHLLSRYLWHDIKRLYVKEEFKNESCLHLKKYSIFRTYPINTNARLSANCRWYSVVSGQSLHVMFRSHQPTVLNLHGFLAV